MNFTIFRFAAQSGRLTPTLFTFDNYDILLLLICVYHTYVPVRTSGEMWTVQTILSDLRSLLRVKLMSSGPF